MHIELSEREQKLFNLLAAIPPDIDAAEHHLQTTHLDGKEVTRVAIEYANLCFCETGDFAYAQHIPHPTNIVPNLHSTYIFDVVKLLLRYNLNPNGIHEDYNIMDSLRYIDNEFLAADTLALLLEHGGRVNLMLPAESETLFQATDFHVFFDAVEQYDCQRYASLVHFWMVLIGYGARCGENKIQVFREYNSSEIFNLQKLKNHRSYYFGLTHLENDFAISIYDKKTLWEVVRMM